MTPEDKADIRDMINARSSVWSSPPPVSAAQASQTSILKWVAGIVGVVIGSLTLMVMAYGATTISNTKDRVSAVEASIEKDRALAEQSRITVNAQLNRIEANTKDRITKTETVAALAVVSEDLSAVEKFALDNRDMLIERSTFMTTTENTLEQIMSRVSKLEERDQ